MPGLVLLRSTNTSERAVNDEGTVKSHPFELNGVSGWSFNPLSVSLLHSVLARHTEDQTGTAEVLCMAFPSHEDEYR